MIVKYLLIISDVMDLSSQRVMVLHDVAFFFTCGFEKSYGAFTLHGMGLGQVEGMGLELMSPNKKIQKCLHWSKTGKGSWTNCFLLCQTSSLYLSRSRFRSQSGAV